MKKIAELWSDESNLGIALQCAARGKAQGTFNLPKALSELLDEVQTVLRASGCPQKAKPAALSAACSV